MALYIPHSIFHLERLLYVRPETFGPYYVRLLKLRLIIIIITSLLRGEECILTSSVTIVIRLCVGPSINSISNQGRRKKSFLLSEEPRPALAQTQPPTEIHVVSKSAAA